MSIGPGLANGNSGVQRMVGWRCRLLVGLLTVLASLSVWAEDVRVITISYDSRETELFGTLNDTTETADALLWGGVFSPTYNSPTDVDYYRLDVSAVPSTLTVLVEGVKTVVISGDPEVWLEDSSGTVLAHSDDIGYPYNLDCFLSYVFAVEGDYYVRVEHSAKTEWYYNYSNYYLSGQYRYPLPLAAVRPSHWMLYR